MTVCGQGEAQIRIGSQEEGVAEEVEDEAEDGEEVADSFTNLKSFAMYFRLDRLLAQVLNQKQWYLAKNAAVNVTLFQGPRAFRVTQCVRSSSEKWCENCTLFAKTMPIR